MTTTLLQQAHDALLSARHAIRNLVQRTDKADWPKWLAVSDATDVVREQIAAVLAAQPAPVPVPVPPGWREALQFYADGNHFAIAADDAWDTVSGEPTNFWCDEAGTATVEDGTVAKMALAGTPLPDEGDGTPGQPGPVPLTPLTDEQIAMWFRRGVGRWMTPGTAFAAGVRSAERHYGIAASPEVPRG